MKLQSLVLLGSFLVASAAPGVIAHQTADLAVYTPVIGQRTIFLSAPRPGVLQNPAPSTDGVRTFVARTSENPYSDRPATATAHPINHGGAELVLVRPREAVPDIAISPWEPITDRMIDELRRDYPWIRRTESIRRDLVIARDRYLRERGHIGSVRGFTNDKARRANTPSAHGQTFTPGAHSAQTPSDADPILVIRSSDSTDGNDRLRERLNESSIIRARTPVEDRSND